MTPYVQFEPLWRASIGPLTESGKGLLSSHLKPQRDLIDSFTVSLGIHTITVQPKTGKMWLDTSQVSDLGSSKLVWSRDMQKEFGPSANNAPFRCVFYSIGLERDKRKIGFRIYPDGRMNKL